MGHLFLDIETYLSPENEESSLNPYKKGSKVLLIAYNYYNKFKPPNKDEIKSPIFLKEWDIDEKAILIKFYNFLKETKNNDKYMKIIGFNITKFDLPYLFGRMKTLKIAGEEELHDLLFRPFGVDLFYLSSIISENTKKHEQLWGTNHKEVSRFFKLQEKEGTGAECSKFYDAKEYDKIIKYCTKEFNFEQLLNAFYLHVIENFHKE